MHKSLKTAAIASTLTGLILSSGAAFAEFSGNVGVTTNYLWRGVTQTNDAPAIQGGLDYADESGFYAGTWASNVDFAAAPDETSAEYELDLYLGYGGEAGAFGYDVGVARYNYPLSEDANFSELYFNGSYSMFSFGVAYTVESEVEADVGNYFVEGDIYYYVGVDFEVSEGVGLGLIVGQYVFDDADDEYTHYGVSLSKDEFSFGIEANDIEGEFPAGKDADDPRVVISWSKSFDL